MSSDKKTDKVEAASVATTEEQQNNSDKKKKKKKKSESKPQEEKKIKFMIPSTLLKKSAKFNPNKYLRDLNSIMNSKIGNEFSKKNEGSFIIGIKNELSNLKNGSKFWDGKEPQEFSKTDPNISKESTEKNVDKCENCKKKDNLTIKCDKCSASYCSIECQMIQREEHEKWCRKNILKNILDSQQIENKKKVSEEEIVFFSKDNTRILIRADFTLIARTWKRDKMFKIWEWGYSLPDFDLIKGSNFHMKIKKNLSKLHAALQPLTLEPKFASTEQVLDILLSDIAQVNKYEYIEELSMGPTEHLYVVGLYNIRFVDEPNTMLPKADLDKAGKIVTNKCLNPEKTLQGMFIKDVLPTSNK
ncbi:MAG TPA: zinc finger MYND domain-containing protein [Verrucomicrobiae bacterium]|nr:zinc finger MYND domain-containing protein [Verrucomicrobiae bacterium]